MLNFRTIFLTSIFISLNLLLGCEGDTPLPLTSKSSAAQSAESPSEITTGTVVESFDAAGYTYVQADKNGETFWLAGPITSLVQGGSIDINTRAPMRNFHSKSLNRDFPVIYFVDKYTGGAVQKVSATASGAANNLPVGHAPIAAANTTTSKKIALNQPVERAENGSTIAEIMTSKKELAGKLVKVRGMVTKFTGDVMKKNWIHIEDGSADIDLVVITDQEVSTGQMAVIEGTVLLDKDFGYGYVYELLIDNAKVTVE